MRSLFPFIVVIACCVQMDAALGQSGQENTPGSVGSSAITEDRPSAYIEAFNASAVISDDPADAIVDHRPLSARILGGGDAEPGEYPSMVALVSPGFASLDRRLFCGATVVAERWVMTAAHCVFDDFGQILDPEFVRAVAGILDLQRDTPDTEHRILRIVVHPDYDRTRDLPPNDIALLELETEMGVSNTTLFTGETENFTDTMGFIAGWGAIEYLDAANAVYPTTLQDAAVPLVSNALCDAPQSYDGLIEDEHLCAGFADGQIDACAGDSGGPLFITVNGEQLQAGITSFGNGCGLPLFYGIYTNVSHFIPWLSKYIEVPFQSPELVAERAMPDDVVVNNDSGNGVFGAASGLYGVSVLLVMAVARAGRRRKCIPQAR